MRMVEKHLKDKAVILSVKPRWSELLLVGKKVVELRRKFPLLHEETPIIFYTSSPVCAVEGIAFLSHVRTLPPQEMWPTIASHCGVSRVEFDTYFDGAAKAVALHIKGAHRLRAPVHLRELRSKISFVPPVSWRWLRPEETFLLEGVTA